MVEYRIAIDDNAHWKLQQLLERYNSGLHLSIQYSETDFLQGLAENAIICRWNDEFGENFANNHPDM